MPYIKSQDREQFAVAVAESLKALLRTDDEAAAKSARMVAVQGELNYLFSKIIWKLFEINPSYTNGNNLVGVLECVKQEFYRRQLSPYEDAKIKENSDI